MQDAKNVLRHTGRKRGLVTLATDLFQQAGAFVRERVRPTFTKDDPVVQITEESSLALSGAANLLKSNGLTPAFVVKDGGRLVIGLPASQISAGRHLLQHRTLSRVRTGIKDTGWVTVLTERLLAADVGAVFAWQINGVWCIAVESDHYTRAQQLLPTRH